MRKACYVTPFYGEAYAGITSSLTAMCREWDRCGIQLDVIPLPAARGRNDRQGIVNYVVDLVGARNVFRQIMNGNYDAAVVREYIPMPGLPRVARHMPLFVESHGASQEMRPLRRRLLQPGLRANRSNAVGLFVITQAIAEREGNSSALPSLVLGNASAMDLIDPPGNAMPIVLYTASHDLPYQGLDILVEIAELLRGHCAIKLVTPASVAAAFSLSLPSDAALQVCPTRTRSDFVNALREADVALGTLALHRSGMTSAEPLKVRDAVAAGIPVVLPYHDPGLENVVSDLIVAIPNARGNPIPIAKAIKHLLSVAQGRRIGPDARAVASMGARERKRIDFMSAVMAKSTPRLDRL